MSQNKSNKNNVGPEKPDVNIVSCERVYDGYFKMDKYRLKHRMYNGNMSEEFDREVLERGHAVAILPYDAKRDKIVLIEQFRPGAYAAGWHPWLVEIVAGIIEEGETDTVEVAKREMMEETGCSVKDIKHIHSFVVSSGCMSETVVTYCANVDSSEALANAGLDEENEDIKVTVVSAEKALDMLKNGEMKNTAAIIAMQWFALNREELRKEWSGQ